MTTAKPDLFVVKVTQVHSNPSFSKADARFSLQKLLCFRRKVAKVQGI